MTQQTLPPTTKLPTGHYLCWRCGQWWPQDAVWWYSRTDNKTTICGSCETMEKIESSTRLGVKPQSRWVVPPGYR